MAWSGHTRRQPPHEWHRDSTRSVWFGRTARAWKAPIDEPPVTISMSALRQSVTYVAGPVRDFYLAGGNLRTWVQFALAADGEPTAAPVEKQVPISPAPWERQRVRIEDLPDLQARFGLRVVGGDPDLDGKPWQPKLYLVEDTL